MRPVALFKNDHSSQLGAPAKAFFTTGQSSLYLAGHTHLPVKISSVRKGQAKTAVQTISLVDTLEQARTSPAAPPARKQTAVQSIILSSTHSPLHSFSLLHLR